jgi:hypothetical protein
MITPAAQIQLYVAERAVARLEVRFQQWVETVTAPLRYVCVGEGDNQMYCTTPLGVYLKDFEDRAGNNKSDKEIPRRKEMSAFSGFSVARNQGGVWFREGTGDPEEDRVTIYTFLVDRDLGDVAYYALRERLAKTILRERNEQSVMLTRVFGPVTKNGNNQDQGLEKEFVNDNRCDYEEFVKAFAKASRSILEITKPTNTDETKSRQLVLAWKLLHLFQLLQRDLMAWAHGHENEEKRQAAFSMLFDSIDSIMSQVFEFEILERMSTTIFVTWLRIAIKHYQLSKTEVRSRVLLYFDNRLSGHKRLRNRSILEIADSLWRYQGHSLAGARDLDSSSCGVEAFAFVAAVNTCLFQLGPDLTPLSDQAKPSLKEIWAEEKYLPFLLLRDWRSLAYRLHAEEKNDLAAAFALRTVDAITKSGISDERTWYQSIKGIFDGFQNAEQPLATT